MRQLTSIAEIEHHITVITMSPKDFKILGVNRDRLDIPDKTNGKAIFGIDVSMPDMLAAVVARPPVFGATMKRFDDTEAKKIPDGRGRGTNL